jgi:hypothetical protein
VLAELWDFAFADAQGQNCGKLAGKGTGVRHLDSTLAKPSIGVDSK